MNTKKEKRELYLFCKNNLMIGFLLRRNSFDRVYIGCKNEDFLERIQRDPAFKQTRKVFYINGSDYSDDFKILNATLVNKEELYNLAMDIVNSLKKFMEGETCISVQNVEV